jgi:hypothetical protein
MNEDTGRKLLVTSFVFAIIIAAWSEIKEFKRPPQPKRFVGAGVAYGLLGLIAPIISIELAGLFGVGLLLTLLYQHVPHSTAEAPKESNP